MYTKATFGTPAGKYPDYRGVQSVLVRVVPLYFTFAVLLLLVILCIDHIDYVVVFHQVMYAVILYLMMTVLKLLVPLLLNVTLSQLKVYNIADRVIH